MATFAESLGGMSRCGACRLLCFTGVAATVALTGAAAVSERDSAAVEEEEGEASRRGDGGTGAGAPALLATDAAADFSGVLIAAAAGSLLPRPLLLPPLPLPLLRLESLLLYTTRSSNCVFSSAPASRVSNEESFALLVEARSEDDMFCDSIRFD